MKPIRNDTVNGYSKRDACSGLNKSILSMPNGSAIRAARTAREATFHPETEDGIFFRRFLIFSNTVLFMFFDYTTIYCTFYKKSRRKRALLSAYALDGQLQGRKHFVDCLLVEDCQTENCRFDKRIEHFVRRFYVYLLKVAAFFTFD